MPGSLLSDDDILRSNDCDYLNLFMKAHRIVSYYVLSEDDYLKHDSNLRYVHSVVAADFSFGVRLLHSYFLNVMKDLAAISSKKGAGALSFDILCGGAIKNYKNSDTGNFFRDAKSCSDNNSRLYSVFKRDMKILNR
jgi:hypothetical protein